MRDLKSNITPVQSIAPSSYSANQNGTSVDTQNHDSTLVLFYLWFGDFANANETYTPKLQESDDNSAWTDVAAGDLGGALTVVDTVGDEGMQTASYKGSKRFVRSVITVSGTTPSILAHSMVLQGHPHNAPTA